MMEAYRSGDPYLAFAEQAKAVPADATKESHRAQRDQFKACVLAVQYGMGAESLATRIGQPVAFAKELLRLHPLGGPSMQPRIPIRGFSEIFSCRPTVLKCSA